MSKIEERFESACERYGELGVDVHKALDKFSKIKISLHCWQGDDIGGFEAADSAIGGGQADTGNYPGKARTPDQLRQDLDKAYSLIPGTHRLNLHAIYLENGGKKVERDEITIDHFQGWIDWAKEKGLGLDFNPTFFAHPKADSGFTLGSPDKEIRDFWIRHGQRCREIGAEMGRQLNSPCVVNNWMPDGMKDIPADRLGPRRRMEEALDTILERKFNEQYLRDSVESKLFGIGSESYVVGSHEYFVGYAVKNGILYCLDAGHFHPTEGIADKLSGLALFIKEFLLHVSRGVRWDSDHVVIWNDELRATAEELVRCELLDRVHIGLDYFDATINRIAAWTIGTRSMLKALLAAILDPIDQLKTLELEKDYTRRLGIMEQMKSMPFGDVWDWYCQRCGVPVGEKWIDEVKKYETEVLSKR